MTPNERLVRERTSTARRGLLFRGRLWVKFALAAAVFVAADQTVQMTLLADGYFVGQRIAPFDPPLFSRVQEGLLRRYEAQLEDQQSFARESVFDSELGWCPRPGMTRAGRTYDWAGARIASAPLPRQGLEDLRLIALVGCSFTEGHEVEGTETWAARITAERPGIVVANFGVGGYGVDQALLRARRDALELEPDELWLGFFPGSALRVTSHFSPIQYHWRARGVLFKPRFILATGGDLRFVPSPAREPADVVRLLRDQRALVDAIGGSDLWIRRLPSAYAPWGSSWMHRSAVARLILTWMDERGREVAPWLSDPSREVYRLHRSLILAMQRDAAARGARFRLLVLPGSLDLAQREEHGTGYWEALVDELAGCGVCVLDCSDVLSDAGGAERSSLWMPGGHYSPEAHQIVAGAIVERWLAEGR